MLFNWVVPPWCLCHMNIQEVFSSLKIGFHINVIKPIHTWIPHKHPQNYMSQLCFYHIVSKYFWTTIGFGSLSLYLFMCYSLLHFLTFIFMSLNLLFGNFIFSVSFIFPWPYFSSFLFAFLCFSMLLCCNFCRITMFRSICLFGPFLFLFLCLLGSISMSIHASKAYALCNDSF